MSPNLGNRPVVTPRRKPTGSVIDFPVCGDWTCDDDEDWDAVGPTDEDYPAVKREYAIAYYHEPRRQWRQRLTEERRRLIGRDDPLWWGRP